MRCSVLALVLTLALVPAAEARITARHIQPALAVAERVFPVVCAGRATPRVLLDVEIGRTGDAAAPLDLCEIWVSYEAARKWTYPEFCTAVLHEYGHLAGLDHSTNPRSVMFEDMQLPDWRCLPEHVDRFRRRSADRAAVRRGRGRPSG